MQIGIDGYALTIPYPCGTKIYASELIQALAMIDKQNEYVVFTAKPIELPEGNFRQVILPNKLPVFKRQLYLAYAVGREKVDVFHYLNPYGSVFFGHPRMVTTVHDMQLGQTYPWVSQDGFKRLSSTLTRYAVLKGSKTVLVPGLSIKAEVEDFYQKFHLKQPEIKVIHYGVNKGFEFKKNSAIKAKKYLVAMGDFAPRKNMARILLAYSELTTKTRLKYQIKIVCSTLAAAQKTKTLVAELGLVENAQILVGLTTEQLADVYRQAAAFLYPSLYEGFGLPILEAMACGCPVVTSRNGATGELGEGAAILVNPTEVRSMTQAILRITTDPKLANKLTNLGLVKAKQYTWAKTARTVKQLYESLNI